MRGFLGIKRRRSLLAAAGLALLPGVSNALDPHGILTEITGRIIVNKGDYNIIIKSQIKLQSGDVVIVYDDSSGLVTQGECSLRLGEHSLYTVRDYPSCEAATMSIVTIDPDYFPHENSSKDDSPAVVKSPTEKTAQNAGDVADIFDERGALTPRGKWIFEPSLGYTHSTATQVAIEGFTVLPSIAVGLIEVSEVQRDTLTGSFTLRYGLTNRLEIETKVPYVYKRQQKRGREIARGTALDTIVSSDGNNAGDIELSIRYQLNQVKPGAAYYLGNLRVKARTGKDPFEVARKDILNDEGDKIGEVLAEQPTGSGFWGVQPSLTVIYPTEPAVLFGNINYLFNLERDLGGDTGKVDPGDAFGFNFGMGFAVNSRTSFSLGYDHSIVFKTDIENDTGLEPIFDKIHIGSLLFGLSHRGGKGRSMSLSLGIGATEQAPDIQLSIKTPFFPT